MAAGGPATGRWEWLPLQPREGTMKDSTAAGTPGDHSPQLHLGWLLEALSASPSAKVPVNLKPDGLVAHTAVRCPPGVRLVLHRLYLRVQA